MKGFCERCGTTLGGHEGKDEPLRWDFTQREIENMMYWLEKSIKELNFVCKRDTGHNSNNAKFLNQIKDDWQRKIDWNIQEGLWK